MAQVSISIRFLRFFQRRNKARWKTSRLRGFHRLGGRGFCYLLVATWLFPNYLNAVFCLVLLNDTCQPMIL